MATFTGQAATNNTFIGSAAADTFLFAAADLTALDTLTGGGGADLLQLTTAGLLAIDALAGMTGIATVQLAAGANSLTFLNNNLTGVTGARITVFGASGADTIDASGLTGVNAVDIRSGAGLDVLKGGSGADTFRFAAADLAGDTVIGGAGADVLVISTAGVLGATALSGVIGVETISLTAGTNGVTLVNGNLTGLGGARIKVIGTSGADTLDGSGLTGTNAAIFLAGSGLDVLRGGAGADVFRFAAADIAGDTVVGGAGSDTLEISTAGLLGAAALSGVSGVETITLADGTNSLTLLNSNMTGVAGSRITVQGNSGADTIDASGVTDSSASVLFNSGAGLDVLRGGAGADTFRLAATDLAGDTVAGGAGSDTLQISTAGVLSNTALSGVSGVETISLTAGTNGLTVLNSNMADVSGSIITIFGASGADTIDGSGLTGANALDIRSGAGLDVLKGGSGADTFRFAAADLAGDTVVGGAGGDILVISTAGVLGAAALSGVSGVETISLTAGTNGLTLVDGNLAGLGGARINVIGTSGADTLDGSGLTGTNAAIFMTGSGLDVLRGGAGADVFRFDAAELAGDTVVGGAGSDTLEITSAGVLGAAALSGVSGVERINLATGTNSLKLLDSNLTGLASSQITVQGNSGADTIDASGLTSTTSSVLFNSGAGIDVLKGGAGADVFRFAATDLSGDTISGGAEVDRLEITTAGTITAAAIAGMTGVETIALTFGTNSIALTNSNFTDAEGGAIDIFGASGNDTIDGSAVTGDNSLAFYAGSGQDTLLGGAGNDLFVFDAINLTGDTISGGGGDDTLILQTRGSTVANGLTQMTGVENVTLSARGNGVTLVDGNFTGVAGRVISVTGGAGNDTVDASRLGAANGVTIAAGGGNDQLKGGAGADVFIFTGTNLTDADIVDGGAGADVLRFDRTTSLLGNSIRNVENLTYTGVGNLAMTISDANASRLSSIGAAAADGFTQTFTIQLSNGSTTDLSRIAMNNRDAADKIVVVSTGGDTAVTLSREISGFTGSADKDTLSGYYRNGAVINGGGGDDRLAYDPAATGIRLDGGEGNDTLVLQDQVGRSVYLDGEYGLIYNPNDGSYSFGFNPNQIIYYYYDRFPDNEPYLNFVTNFENIDASATTTGVDISGRSDVSSYLIGGSGSDSIYGSAGATILGGLGSDFLESDGSARYLVRNTAEANDDYFGFGTLHLLGDTDLRGANVMSNVLLLAAGTVTGMSVTAVNADLSASIYAWQLPYLPYFVLSGNATFANTTETLTIYLDEYPSDFSAFNFQNWSGNDHLEIVGLDSNDDTIIGSSGKDVISGLGGADNINGQGGDDVINGEAGNDRIFGGFGADQLTGGSGQDTFVWNAKQEGGDRINDFTRGQDKLAFDSSAFMVDGVFGNLVIDTVSSADNLGMADLFVAGTTLSSAAQVRSYINNENSVTPHGMFIIAVNSAGNNILYYTSDASTTADTGLDKAVYQIADLGMGTITSDIMLDLLFV
ncbi:calcium-binding protein [Novosphingobium sp.]|uniref:beta strand repeat-containing protein n=1 Tax=Novosphingobium sp. TaxID=1874826 RepID=UPI00261F4ED6|nr:calcium-binding protein [Novosphingobium sp.]